MVIPPCCFTTCNPAAPSWPPPVKITPQLGGRKRGWLSGIGHSQLAGRIIPSDLFPSACILPQAKGDGQVVQHRSFSALSPCSLLRAERTETLSDEESREGD